MKDTTEFVIWVILVVVTAGVILLDSQQDRRIAALEDRAAIVTFSGVVIRTQELDSLIMARLDSLEKRISAGWVWVSAAGNAQVWAKPTTDILARLDSLEARIDSAEVWWKIWRELRLKQFRRPDEKAH